LVHHLCHSTGFVDHLYHCLTKPVERQRWWTKERQWRSWSTRPVEWQRW
jgi:hypothetical protein